MLLLVNGKPTMLGAASGAVAGLAAITPAAGLVTPMASIVIGGVAGVVCWYACSLKMKLRSYDDALDVVGVHFVGGTWGAIATGLFASVAAYSGLDLSQHSESAYVFGSAGGYESAPGGHAARERGGAGAFAG